jgi:hypothetical protein
MVFLFIPKKLNVLKIDFDITFSELIFSAITQPRIIHFQTQKEEKEKTKGLSAIEHPFKTFSHSLSLSLFLSLSLSLSLHHL